MQATCHPAVCLRVAVADGLAALSTANGGSAPRTTAESRRRLLGQPPARRAPPPFRAPPPGKSADEELCSYYGLALPTTVLPVHYELDVVINFKEAPDPDAEYPEWDLAPDAVYTPANLTSGGLADIDHAYGTAHIDVSVAKRTKCVVMHATLMRLVTNVTYTWHGKVWQGVRMGAWAGGRAGVETVLRVGGGAGGASCAIMGEPMSGRPTPVCLPGACRGRMWGRSNRPGVPPSPCKACSCSRTTQAAAVGHGRCDAASRWHTLCMQLQLLGRWWGGDNPTGCAAGRGQGADGQGWCPSPPCHTLLAINHQSSCPVRLLQARCCPSAASRRTKRTSRW